MILIVVLRDSVVQVKDAADDIDDDAGEKDDERTEVNEDDAENETQQLNGLLNECIILLRSVTTLQSHCKLG